MKITKYFTQFSRSYTICLREYKLGEIIISSHCSFTHEYVFSKPEINWAGCGGQDINKTEIMIKALKVATVLAGSINSTMTEEEVKLTLNSEFHFDAGQILF